MRSPSRSCTRPGHRPEHCAFVVGGSLVLSGDSLFVGDAARPDLAIEARAGATDLFRSLQRLSALPDGLALYPGHVAGSLCGAHMSPDHSSTIGRERATNHALLGNDLTSFVEESASLSTPRPPTTERLVELNRGPWVGARAPLGPVRPPDGTLVLDVRPIAAFAAGHAQGAISVALDGGSFATRSAFVVGVDEPFVVRADSAEQAHEAQRLLDAVGLAGALGFVTEDGTAARLPTMTVAEVARAAMLETLQILDVREEGERTSTIPGSTAIPYRELRRTVQGELDRSRPVVTICESGQRATLAASLLARAGYDARAVIGGGVGDLLRNGAGGRFDVM